MNSRAMLPRSRIRGGTPSDPTRDRNADLVIASVYMPKNAGVQSIPDIQAAHRGTPLIASYVSVFRPGARPLRAKPVIKRDLLEAARGIIGMRK